MKVALVMIICSQIAGECMPPHFMKHHDNFYECLIGGYEEALNKTKEIGKTEIVKNEIIIKFNCYYDTNYKKQGV